MKPPRLHPIPLGVKPGIGTSITELANRERNTPAYQPHQTYTGRELLERIRATPDHLRVGESDTTRNRARLTA